MSFKKLQINSETFLKKNENNHFLYGISFAHILKKHPAFDKLLKKKDNTRKILNYFIRFINDIITLRFFKKTFLAESEVLIVSNLLNQKYLNDKDDFYFGNFNSFLNKNKISNFFLLRNFTSIDSEILNNRKKSENKFILSNLSDFNYEFFLFVLLLKNYIWENFKLIFNDKTNQLNFNKFLKFNSIRTSVGNHRLAYQILKICKKVKPKIIIFTYEGHAWEKLLISKIKKFYKKKITCIGYQFSTLTTSSYSIFKKRKKIFMPDYILTTGYISKKKFIEKRVLPKNKILKIGSFKNIKTIFNYKSRNKNILVLPEGFLSETKLLVEFIISLSKKNKQYKFIIRLHPLVDRNYIEKKIYNYKNIILSKNKILNKDIKISSYVFYRGTSAVFDCIFKNVHPIYIDNKDGISIDPLFFIKKRSILKIDKVETNLDVFLKNETRKEKSKKIYEQANKFFSSIDYSSLEKILKKNIKFNSNNF